MIDLVYEIRRRVDSTMKPSVKMANPELLSELANYHLSARDTVCKTLIKELLFLAGGSWAQLLNSPQGEAPKPAKQLVKVYRGQTQLIDAPTIVSAPPKPQRMYRGHPVD
jgi:hypothetical protein